MLSELTWNLYPFVGCRHSGSSFTFSSLSFILWKWGYEFNPFRRFVGWGEADMSIKWDNVYKGFGLRNASSIHVPHLKDVIEKWLLGPIAAPLNACKGFCLCFSKICAFLCIQRKCLYLTALTEYAAWSLSSAWNNSELLKKKKSFWPLLFLLPF